MNFEEYRVASKRTINNMLSDEELKLHGICGLMSEVNEIADVYKEVAGAKTLNDRFDAEKHCLSEIGDALWFVAEIATAENIRVPEDCIVVGSVTEYITEYCTIVQKRMQGKAYSEYDVVHAVGCILACFRNEAAFFGYKLSDLYEQNLEKLRKRYPEGFSEERSEHRAEGDI